MGYLYLLDIIGSVPDLAPTTLTLTGTRGNTSWGFVCSGARLKTKWNRWTIEIINEILTKSRTHFWFICLSPQHKLKRV